LKILRKHKEKKMVNKKFLLAMLAIVLVLGMTVAGCDAQIVAFEQVGAVTGVVVKYEADINQVRVLWAASKNAEFYELFYQSEPEKDMGGIGIDETHMVKTDGRTDHLFLFSVPANGGYSGDANVEIRLLTLFSDRGRFGVAANDNDVNHARSDIVWSEYITIPPDRW
jgi:hypothetical protein